MDYLHDYQVEPVERFIERGNLLCALDTGGGKTVITIAAAEELLAIGRVKRVMIVVPSSLKYQWAEKLAAFTDLPSSRKKLTLAGKRVEITIAAAPGCVVIDGTPDQRRDQYRAALGPDCEYVIMGYDQPMDDWRQVRRLNPEMVVVDEASCLRSPGSKRSQFYKANLWTPYRLALTATPAENGKPEEMYSIMEWVDPSVFGQRVDLFDRTYVERDDFGRPVGWKNLDVFRQKIAPALFSLNKDDPELARHLPKRKYHEWTVPLDSDTWDAYEMIATELAVELGNVSGGTGWDIMNFYGGGKAFTEGSGMGRTAGRRIALEMLLDHPYLLRYSAREYLSSKGESGSEYAAHVVDDPKVSWLDWSPKLQRLYLELHALVTRGDPKVMIFSRYPKMLHLIAENLPDDSYVQYDGTMTPKQKAAATARFRSDDRCKYFLSSHAGAKGNDMPMASWLINYDLDWSAGTADQINGRHVRASSEFEEVHIVNMVCENTVEERKAQVVDQKRDVSNALVRTTSRTRSIDNEVDSLRRFLVDTLGLDG